MPTGKGRRSGPRYARAERTHRERAARGLVESLEGRTLLTVTVSGFAVTVSGDDNGATSDQFVIRRLALLNDTQVLMNGVVVFTADTVNVATITINGGFLDDTLTVSFVNGNPFSDRVTFNGGFGFDTMRLGASDFAYDATFNGGTEPFGASDRDTLEMTVNAGIDLTLDAVNSQNGNIVRPGFTAGRVDYTGLSELALTGGTGNNTFNTTEFVGRTTLVGGAGNDTLRSGSGSDRLNGGDGNDFLEGGAGNDTYVFATAGGTTEQVDQVQERTGGGVDTFDFSALPATDPIDLQLGSATSAVARHTLRTVNASGPAGDPGTHMENAFGGAGDDRMADTRRRNSHFRGGPGNDIIQSGPGGDFISDVDDDDLVEGGPGNDTLNGGTGDDEIHGEDGDDDLFGNTGNDLLLGGPGNDDVTGADGDDTMNGGLGNDVIDGDGGIFGEQLGDTLIYEATGGIDFISVGGSVNSDFDISRRAGQFTEVLELDENSGIEHLRVFALGGDDVVDMRPLLADAVNDTLVDGGAGADTLRGGRGNDVLRGGDGPEIDTLEGNAGNDTLAGGGGQDVISGGDGDDTLDDPGNPADLGAGEDGLLFRGTDGNDVIHVSWQPGPRAVVTVNGVIYDAPYLNGETIFVFAGAGNDRVTMDEAAGIRWKADFSGGPGNDRLSGSGNADRLDGGGGHDLLQGAAGNDVLLGGAGSDLLIGGEGDDDLDGGPGFDLLIQGDWPTWPAAGSPLERLLAVGAELLLALEAADGWRRQ